jgi:two-component system CheB/CheR fusion protein
MMSNTDEPENPEPAEPPHGEAARATAPGEADGVDEDVEPGSEPAFSIVGVGASAGGLDAFTQLLKGLPDDTGMAFVLVQHLAPSHPSALAEILSRATKMPVTEVQGEPEVEPNHVYVIPPDRSMIIVSGALQLLPREGRGAHHPIDQFFRSLAEELQHRAIGVVLSGTANDGTLGLEAIKASGGITFAQDATAQHEGMPKSAIASGSVDFVLPPSEIAKEIVRIGQHPYTVPEGRTDPPEDKPSLVQVVQILHQATGVDFTHYKFNTLYRRITRRMVFQKMTSLRDYVPYLRHNAGEVDALYQDILINVTSFFRDPESFEALKTQVFPVLIKNRSPNDPVRLWTLGCSTGQEAYSLVMAFTEAANAVGSTTPIQLFATDHNAAGIEKARAGIYSKDIAQDVSPERLRRFFTEVDGSYRISKTIRDSCVFSRHNVLADPPFSRIDVISCRNLLIYLEPVLQQRVMPLMHYALKPSGCLWLGGSETIGNHRNLFQVQDAKHKIYVKKPGSTPGYGHFQLPQAGVPRVAFAPVGARPNESAELQREADRVLSGKFAPPAVLVSADLEILQFRGETGPYLAPAPGKASLNLLKMLREGLMVAVRAAVLRAGKEGITVREEGLKVRSNEGYEDVAVEVIPLRGQGAKEGSFLVLFESSQDHRPRPATRSPLADGRETAEREMTENDSARVAQELAATREFLQSVIEQQEAANEELQSANEEVQSANEELQSTNEELETSKEEIQSSNEELATVNDELNNRNAEMNRVNNDLVNLLGSVQMGIVMLGPDLRIRRFTESAERSFNLISTDVGRPLADIKSNLDLNPDELDASLRQVLETLTVKELEVRDKRGAWYSLRVRPYRTLDNRIDGVVVLLVDVDVMKRAELATAQLAAIVNSSEDAILSQDPEGVVLSWNKGAENLFGYTAGEIIGETADRLIPAGVRVEFSQALERVYRGEVLQSYETVGLRKDGTLREVSFSLSPILDAQGRIKGAARIARNITERKRAQQALIESHARFESLFNNSPTGISLVDADFKVRLMNRPSLAVFGALENLIGRDFGEVIHILWPPEVASDVLERFKHTLLTGESYSVPEFNEERYDRKVREYYDWQIHRIGLPDGRFGVVCYFVDISARVLAEQSLRQGENRLRFIMESIPQKILTATPEGAVDYYNPQWFEFTGLTFDQIKDSGWKQFIHPDDLGESVRAWENSMATGEECILEQRFRRADGEYRWHLSRTVAMRDPQRKVSMWIGSNTDIHEQWEAANRLRRYAAETSEANHQKSEFLAMLAHELRNPLAPIGNALQILQSPDTKGKADAPVVAMLEQQVSQMVRLVDDLLDASRISLGRIELRFGHIELTSLVSNAADVVRPLCKSLGHELTLNLPEGPIYLKADPTRLTQVVGNLLNNACKFTPNGGSIWVSVECEDKLAVIRVRDKGVGIAEAQLRRIFDLFMQVDTSLERSAGGLGIGLTLVKRLVELHNGTVEVHSAGLGQGSEFVVRLPILDDTGLRSIAAAAAGERERIPSRRILVVDDNHDSADSLAMLLRLNGHETRTAHDGLQAVDAALAFRPEVILLDLGMPNLNGYEACRRIRAQASGKDIMIIATTGWGQDQAREASKAAGFDAHLVKPVNPAELARLLANAGSSGTRGDQS